MPAVVEVWNSVMQQWLPWPVPEAPADRYRRYTTRGVTVVAPPQSTVRTVVR